VCGHKLSRRSRGHARTFETRFGAITVERTRGYCKRCHKWRLPADAALGLEESAGYSPAVQDMAALLASKMPVEEASTVLEHLTGVKLPRATLDREARRQGERAQALRTEMDAQAATEKRQLELTLEPCQLIIQLDAWNIRERDAWGQSPALRRKGRNRNAGTGFIPAPVFVWIIAARRPVAGRSSVNGALSPPGQAWTPCGNNCMPKRCGAAWGRRPAR
jgi:hypothetical protein